MKFCEKKIEAVCDCGASVSCLSPLIYHQLEQRHKLDVKPCVRKVRPANGLPIEVKRVVRVPVVIGPKSYEHDFCVLDKSEADCLLGLDFLETNKCDPLFSCMKLQLDSHSFVTLYHKKFDYGHDVFRVISTRRSQFHLVIRESFLPTYPTRNDPQYKSVHYSNLRTSLNEITKCPHQMYVLILQKRSFR